MEQSYAYTEFRNIIQGFVSKQINILEMIQSLSKLFTGHSHFLLGLNRFLPPGYKVEVQVNGQINVHRPGQPVTSLSTGSDGPVATPNPVSSSAPTITVPTPNMESSTEQNQDQANMMQQQQQPPGNTSTGSGVHGEGGSPPGAQAAHQPQPQPSAAAALFQAPLPRPGQQQIQGPPQQQGQQQQAQTIRHTLDDALSQAGRPVRAALRLSQAPPPQQGQRLLPYLEQHQEAEVFRELQISNILSYLKTLKEQFGEQSYAYTEFRNIIQGFVSKQINILEMIQSLSKLFTGHSHFLLGLNRFLPPGYKVEVQVNGQINVHRPGQPVTSLSTGSDGPVATPNPVSSSAPTITVPTPNMESSIEQNQDQANMMQQQQQPPGNTSTGSGVHGEGGSPPGAQAAHQPQPQPSAAAALFQAPLPRPGQQQIQGPPQQQGQQQQAQTIRHTLDDALSQAGRPVRAALRLSQAPPPQQGQRLLPYLEQHQEAEVFRELQISNILSYLKTLKEQFGEQSYAYTEFRNIIQGFVSKQINILEMIQSLSKLFTGHSHFLLGLNRFLPPGYKVEVQVNGQINVHRPGQPVTSLSTGSDGPVATPNPVSSSAPTITVPTPNMESSTEQNQDQANMMQQQQQQPGNTSTGSGVHGEGGSPPGAQQPQPQPSAQLQGPLPQQGQQQQQAEALKVQNAISYYDQVLQHFDFPSPVYTEFLKIMKFKLNRIATLDVINDVSNLFSRYPHLIMGFNPYLPPGYKIEVQANGQIRVHQPGQAVMPLSTALGRAAAAQNGANSAADTPKPLPSSTATPNVPPPQAGGAVGSHHSYDEQIPQPGSPQDAAQTMSSPPQAQHQQAANLPEVFTILINYINKVKDQFKNQSGEKFLKIMHKYQQEQGSIKEGQNPDAPLTKDFIDQLLSLLFKNEEDLPEEFKQIFPRQREDDDEDEGSASGGLFGLPLPTQLPAKE